MLWWTVPSFAPQPSVLVSVFLPAHSLFTMVRSKTGSAIRTPASRGRQAGRGRGRQTRPIPPQDDIVVHMTDMDSSDEDNASVAAPVPVPAPAPAPAPVPVPMTPTGRPRNPLNIALERKIHLIR